MHNAERISALGAIPGAFVHRLDGQQSRSRSFEDGAPEVGAPQKQVLSFDIRGLYWRRVAHFPF